MVTAGLAEVAAGSIAMGLGGYLAARGDAEHYASERGREQRETIEIPEAEAAEVADVFASYGLTPAQSAPVVAALRERPDAWVNVMMRFELGLEEPDPKRALTSAVTIAVSYIAGGLIPLSPYVLAPSTHGAPPIGRGHAARPADLRLCQRPLHGCGSGPERASDHDHRRPGSGGGLPHRPPDHTGQLDGR